MIIREATPEDLGVIAEMNATIFLEERIMNRMDRDDVLMLLAEVGGAPAGFKVGYRQSAAVYYSAKGGVLPAFRGHGIARGLMDHMMAYAKAAGYERFAFDTFPNRHPGMAVMALRQGFRLTEAEFHDAYQDFRLRFEHPLDR